MTSKHDEVLHHIGAVVAFEGDKLRSEWAAGLSSFANGTRLQGARYLLAPTTARVSYAGQGRLVGWSLLASAGPVRIILRDGHDSSGDAVAVIDLADQESETVALAGAGISISEALFSDVSGNGAAGLIGALHLGPGS